MVFFPTSAEFDEVLLLLSRKKAVTSVRPQRKKYIGLSHARIVNALVRYQGDISGSYYYMF
jgi:hypothetical protein